ncbi:MAG: DUF805 domain-containing protein [Actinobacteria bacterium]|uniref:Unannotated protein n=1 Tax=freshwater metagenome TaxID=449393 RepID=A0A6J7DZB8_9ZZZZ|nr:DUF805 domain-containing protein [Actinomycetota bacterium]
MSFAEAVKTGFSKYATFDGRAKRSEFWWWYLFETLAVLVFMLPAALFIGLSAGNGSEANGAPLAIGIILYVVGGLVALALLVPTYAVGCRRLHDRGQSGWLQLLILVPCGNIALIVLWALEGTPTDNAYGPAST